MTAAGTTPPPSEVLTYQERHGGGIAMPALPLIIVSMAPPMRFAIASTSASSKWGVVGFLCPRSLPITGMVSDIAAARLA